MTAGWQTQVSDQPALGIAGDKASNNPYATYDVGPYGLVAGSKGVTIGRFAWTVAPDDPNGTPSIANSFGAGNVAGFVAREQQGSNSTYLSDAGMSILAGYQMTLMTGGDFLAVNSGTGQVTRGMKAYADFLTGAVTFAATASPTTGASATGSSIAAVSSTFTGSITGNILNVTSAPSNTLYPGATLSGTGVISTTQIVSQLTGTTGGVGTYLVNIPEQTAASTTITAAYGILTIGTLTTTPVFAVGDTLNATGSVVAGTQISANITGAGGTGGTMVVTNNTVVSSQTISAVGNVETPWYALNDALAGEIVKIGAPVASYGSQLS